MQTTQPLECITSSKRIPWNYYGYNGKGQASNAVPGLAAIPISDFNVSTAEFALRYAF